jgi:hypothetical protein
MMNILNVYENLEKYKYRPLKKEGSIWKGFVLFYFAHIRLSKVKWRIMLKVNFIYLFFIYLMVLSIAKIIYIVKMLGRFTNKLEKIRKKLIIVYHSICL